MIPILFNCFPQDCGKTLIFWGFASDLHPVISSVLLSATRKNYTQVLGVVQIGGVVIAGDCGYTFTSHLQSGTE